MSHAILLRKSFIYVTIKFSLTITFKFLLTITLKILLTITFNSIPFLPKGTILLANHCCCIRDVSWTKPWLLSIVVFCK